MTTATSRGELERLLRGDTMALPSPSPMWDEWRTWPTTDRKRLARFMGGTFQPDELATELGTGIDDALRQWRTACFVALDNGSSDQVDAAEWEWQATIDALKDIVGPLEVADMLGVKVDTVHQWRKRDLLPAPCRVISKVPLWTRAHILGWALETGRIVPELVEIEKF